MITLDAAARFERGAVIFFVQDIRKAEEAIEAVA
jgi:hypothetical protein